MEEYPTDFVSTGSVEYVYTTHVIHQEQFYVHLDTRSSILEEIMDALETRYSKLAAHEKTLPQVKLGGLCAAKFTDDNNWYRVKITGLLQSGLIEVNFVDYGNTDYVSQDRVKRLDPDLIQYPVQSYRCALAGVSCKHGLWTPELRVQFEDLVIDKRCKAVFSAKTNEDIYLMDMYDESGNHINKYFGAAEKKVSETSAKVKHGNGSNVVQGFESVSWREGQKVQAVVVYVTNPGVFWCQEVAHTNSIIILSEELSRLHMTQEMGPLNDIRPGSICAAKFHEDEAWYRGIIQSVSGKKAQVYFVDYGNTESVELDSICELKAEFRRLPALAVKCSLASFGGSLWSAYVVEEFEKLVVDREFEVNVVGRNQDAFEVSLLDIEENRDIGNRLKQIIASAGVKAQTPPKSVNMNDNNNASKHRGFDLPVGSKTTVFLSWVDNPSDFWVQQEQLSDTLDTLSSELQEFYNEPRPMTQSKRGTFVIARFSDDQQWYRGLVVKEFEDNVQVLFIDYGNTDTIAKTELRQASPKFGQIDPLAFRCSLKGVKPLPQDNSWSVDAKDFIEKLTENGCQCEVLDKNDVYRFVGLNVNGKDVAQELVSLAVVTGSQPSQVKNNIPSYSKSPGLQENQVEQVTVTHVDSPQSFWLQFNKSHPQLDALMEKLDCHYSEEGGTPVPKPSVGQACVAQYSEDNAWYRAAISNVSQSGCNVQFVDYGNQEFVSPNLACVVEPRFLDLPTQAINCSLSLTGDVSHLTDNLSSLVLEKEVTMKVISTKDQIPSVDLILDGQSVCNILKNQVGNSSASASKGNTPTIKPAKPIPAASTVKAYTSMVHSPDKFFLQIAGIDEELAALMDEIALHYVSQAIPAIGQPSAGMQCAALYDEDKQWYRGQIVSVQGDHCKVLFVDYGNEELVSNSFVKALIPEVSATPILAYECSLHGINKVDTWPESAVTFFESLVMDQELNCKFIDKSTVTIECNGEDVAGKLISGGHCQPTQPGPGSSLNVSTAGSSFGSKSPKSPGFGQSPRKDESNAGGFGGNRREDQGSFGGRGNGPDKGSFKPRSQEGFDGRGGDGESRGFGGKGGDRDGGFGGRGGDGESRGFGGRGGDRDGDSGGFGKRDRNPSAGSSSSTADKFTYADPPSGPESAILVHIDEDGTFYLQLPSMEKDILFLSKRLAGSYKTGGPPLKETVAKGTVCCCKFPDDGSMYRCQVEALDRGKALVRYMDFGNFAEHRMNDLRFLFPDLLQYPVQAFPCKLRELEWTLDQADKFGSATLDKDLEVTFTSTSPPYLVDIKTPDGDLLSIMTGKIVPPAAKISSPKSPGQGGGFGSKSSTGFGGRGGPDASTPKKSDMSAKRSLGITSSPPKPSVPKQIFKLQTAPSESQMAFISHISVEGDFYLQLEKDTALLENLTQKLTALDSSIIHPDLSKGSACAAIFSEDSSWYRALISEINGAQYDVTFVDFGNGDKVSKENIRPLTEDLLATPPIAFQCRFADEEEVLSVESKTKLEEYLMEHQLSVSFSGQSAPFPVTAATSDGQDLHQLVCPSNTFRTRAIPKEVTPVGVAHIEEDGRFFTCIFKQYKTKANIHKALQEHCSSSTEPLETPEVDMPCCAKLSSDDQWYRCRIVSISDSKAVVQFVDNGNCESLETSDLKLLPTDFLKEAPFALECRLKGVESWTDDLKEKFIDMTQDKILNATYYGTSPQVRVSLARSIELDLLGLNAPEPDSPRKTVGDSDSIISKATINRSVFQGGDSYVTEVTPDGHFFVQLVSEEEQLQIVCDHLEELMSTPQDDLDNVEVGEMLCAKFTEDDVWYRAIVEVVEGDQFTVRFVDYGNSDTLGKDRLASLVDDISPASIPAFAYKCKLAEPMTRVEDFKTAVMDKLVVIKMVTDEADDTVFTVSVEVDGQTVILTQETETVQAESEQQVTPSSTSSERTTVTVVYVINPSQFCVQLQADEAQLDTMMNELYEEVTNLAEGEGLVDALAVGDLCTALYEDSWYRVKVTKLGEDQSVEVLYVDHGNSETVSDKSNLRVLSSKYQSLPIYGHEARLPGIKPLEGEWSEEAIETFRGLVEEKSLLADLIDTSNDESWVVQLLDMGTPLQDTLISKGYGVATESVAVSKSTKQVFSDVNESVMAESTSDLLVETAQNWKKKIGCISNTLEELKQVTAFISHCDNPSQIWCQLASSTDDLEEVGVKLETAYSSVQDCDKIVGELNSGDLVIGLFEDDGQRYRSAVLKSQSPENSGESDKLSLRFIDYGNCGSCSKDDILTIKEELCQQPALSFCCCLDKVQPIQGDWSSEACNRFSELTADQELLLTLVGRKQDGTALVDMTLQETGKSLCDILIEEGLAKSLDIDTSLPVKAEKGDVSECLEITQPIMESTAMVDEATTNFQTYSIEYAVDGYYKCIELSLHSSYDIIVSDDELPNAFCVQLRELSGQLDTLKAQIAEYVSRPADDNYAPKVGDACLVLHESLWYRGLIRMNANSGKLIVVSVDCGWEVGVDPENIRSIPSQFLDLPGQAIHCYLAGIVSGEPEWSAEAITYFTEYIRDHDLTINVEESAEDGKYGVSATVVQDSSAECSPSLNQLFVERFFAEVVPGSNIDVQLEMDKTLDSDMLNELEQSFKDVEKEKESGQTDEPSEDQSGPPSFHSADDDSDQDTDSKQPEECTPTSKKDKDSASDDENDEQKHEKDGDEELTEELQGEIKDDKDAQNDVSSKDDTLDEKEDELSQQNENVESAEVDAQNEKSDELLQNEVVLELHDNEMKEPEDKVESEA